MRKSGILAHPTSFPSKYGIGDLGKGAYEFVDFLEKSGQKLWQILPLGQTSFGDSPYQSFSAFAGNIYIISPDIFVKKGYLSKKDIEIVPEFDEKNVEYGKVINYKMSLFRTAFKKFKENKEYLDFCDKNAFWLEDYSLFMSLKNYFIEQRKNTYESAEYKAYYSANEKKVELNAIKDCFYGGAWNSFPEDIRDRKPKAVEKNKKMLKSDIDFYKFLQYEFFTQWQELKEYANEKKIEIIGDIPIFVAEDSADVWSNRNLFSIDSKGFPKVVAGVPPDYFSADGQLWGNPLYDWKEHSKTGYDWWTKRIENAFKLCDIVRIDHFRGFESYWEIPFGEKTAVNGKWKKGPKEEIFNVMENKLGKLNIIAEDLGDLTDEVLDLRDELGFPGMKILQFAFDSDEANAYLPFNYETTNCVVYTGTHDNDTTKGWYSKADKKATDYVRRLLNVSGEDIAWDLIRMAVGSVAKYAVIPIQDVMNLGSDARMNTPGKAEDNWQFRFTEDMLTDNMAKGMKYLVKIYNR